MSLTCTTRIGLDDAGGSALVTASGVVDVATAPLLRETLAPLIADGVPVVVDLRDVSFLDSSGLGVLVGAKRRLRSAGGGLAVVNARPAVFTAFAVAGLVESLGVTRAPEAGVPRARSDEQHRPVAS